jgi:DNA polymerase-3 subunit chi
MTRVDFYILADADPGQRDHYTCRLVEKAWRRGLRIFIHCADEADAALLDERLWTFRDRAFLPHERSPGSDDTAVILGSGDQPPATFDLLVNRAAEPPLFFSQFERVAEVVNQDPAVRDPGRRRFAFYRDRGYPLHHHRIEEAAA